MKRINEDEIMRAIRDMEDEAYERFGYDVKISVDTMISVGEALSVTVSWASTGEQTPEDAVTFASKILEAAEMARAFPYNGAVLMPSVIDEEGYEDYWYEMEDEQGDEAEETSDGMTVIPDDGSKDFWDMMMERERADMKEFEQMKRERALRGYETGMTAEDIAVRWPE